MMSFSPWRHLSSIFIKNRPIHLTLFLTRRCNARCPFCFYLSGQDRAQSTDELSLAELEKIAASMGDLLWLAFSGGEIFLRKDLVEIATVFYQYTRPAIILLPTNGLLPETIRENIEAILKNCPQSTIAVKLSLDGPAATHDGLRGVAGSYAKTMETCEILSPLLDRYPNFELGINTVFCAKNQDEVEGVIDLVAGMDKIKTHTVSLIRGEVGDNSLKQVDLEKYREVIKLLESRLKKGEAATYRMAGARLKAAQDILQRNLIYQTARDRKIQTPCYAGRLNLVITETGDLYPCETFEERFKLGNLRESGYDSLKILKSAAGRQIVNRIKQEKCFCTHECYMMTNILFNPARYPALFKEYLRVKTPKEPLHRLA